MINFNDWRDRNNTDDKKTVSREELFRICQEYFGSTIRGGLKTHHEFQFSNIIEAVETSRYAIEVNYRTTSKEALEGFAKLALGYVSAALKNYGYHTKHVFEEKPLRLLVSSRNWDDGEWTGLIVWNHDHNCFMIGKGFYNKDRKTVSIQSSHKCSGNSAADLSKEMHNMMHHLKDKPDRQLPKLKPVPLKRGPKR
jgi:hypothetical protein